MIKLPSYVDTECYVNYFLAMFMTEDGRTAALEMFDDQPLDTDALRRILTHPALEHTSFNGNSYDIPMLRYALSGASCAELKALSDEIIVNELRPWDVEKRYQLPTLEIDHVDLIEVAPGMNGLKTYGGRLHLPKLQDLPLPPDAVIKPEDRPSLRYYCTNDLRTTQALRRALSGAIDLRRTMTAELNQQLIDADLQHIFGTVDLRSKSDAQIAEAVLKQRVFLATGAIPRKRPVTYRRFKYEPPEYIRFKLPVLQETLQLIREADMVVGESGHVQMPREIEKLSIHIGKSTYKMGIGGLHSQESSVSHYADDEHYLRDIDVRSYYPNLMLNMNMYPDSMGPHFLTAYRSILVERLEAKDAGDKVKDSALKITLNGTFGKTSSQYSVLYNPRMMIATTLTGQLSILMLIELFERGGIDVISANTDGIVIRCRRDKEVLQRHIVKVWEQVTNLETEETDYRSIHSRDVNSYIAIKTNGDVKTKGFFALPKTDRDRLAKSPQNEVCVMAVIEHLSKGTPAEVTVKACTDLTKFLSLKRVTGGAEKDGDYLGKVVRWYYSTESEGTINYVQDGRRVGRTRGAKPCMDLPEEFPHDIDYAWYIAEADEMLMDIGFKPRPVMPKLPRRNTKKWKELEALGLVEVDDDKPKWAVRLDEIPDEYKQH